MTFSQFATLFRLYRFFTKYGVEKPQTISPDEFAALLGDPEMDPEYIGWLDSEVT